MTTSSAEAVRFASAVMTAAGAVWTSVRRAPSAAARGRQRPTRGRSRDAETIFPSSTAWDLDAAPWTALSLKHTLHDELHGDQIIVVANREPCIHEFVSEGRVRVRYPASGLVTALEPVVRACGGVWIAHGSGSADREMSDAEGRIEVTKGGDQYRLRRLWLTADEERGYYYGFANEALWPLCHRAHVAPVFRRSDWAQYRRVNARFADAVVAEANVDDPIVLVQDYHFALLPALIRERLPRATVLAFWHIPWPAPETLAICPYHRELVQGLLGGSIVGFQTAQDCRHFVDAVDTWLEARVERDGPTVVQHGHATAVRAYPISIEWPSCVASEVPPVDECRRLVRRELGLAPDTELIVSVDRLDYTKGIEERLSAFEHLLARRKTMDPPVVLLQVAVPSRVLIPTYTEFGARVRAQIDRVNATFGRGAAPSVTFIEQHCEPDEIARFYRAADVCFVSSRHDGMNLVAKEFIGVRDDEHGVLVLSQFAGAARELREAVVVNPYDVERVADALDAALGMSDDEQRIRMQALRAHVAQHNVYRWAGGMLKDANRLRRVERILRRIGS